MRRRSLERIWRAALPLIAFFAVALALYVQLVERRSREEADRIWAARLEAELAESRERLEAETQARLRAEAERRAAERGDQPSPNTVLRRGEAGALQQVLDARDEQRTTLARLQESVDALERQVGQSDRALRRDLEELRMEVRREQEASSKIESLLLVALIPLLLHLITSLWPRSGRRGDRRSGEDPETPSRPVGS